MKNKLKAFKILKQGLGQTTVGEISESQAVDIFEICNLTNAKNILEIGFNRGGSCLAWLLGSETGCITSIDINMNIESICFLHGVFNNRFSFINTSSFSIGYTNCFKKMDFDLVFIDGWHDYDSARNDTAQALNVNPKYIVYDDVYNASHRSDILKAISEFDGLELVKDYKNGCGLGLYKVTKKFDINFIP